MKMGDRPPTVIAEEQLAATFPFFTEDELRAVAQFVTPVFLKQGQILYSPGDVAESCYFLIEGCVGVKKLTGFDGKKQIIALLTPYAPIGESGLTEIAKRTAMITGVEDCTLMELSRGSFEKLQSRYPAAAVKLLRHLLLKSSKRLEKCTERLILVL